MPPAVRAALHAEDMPPPTKRARTAEASASSLGDAALRAEAALVLLAAALRAAARASQPRGANAPASVDRAPWAAHYAHMPEARALAAAADKDYAPGAPVPEAARTAAASGTPVLVRFADLDLGSASRFFSAAAARAGASSAPPDRQRHALGAAAAAAAAVAVGAAANNEAPAIAVSPSPLLHNGCATGTLRKTISNVRCCLCAHPIPPSPVAFALAGGPPPHGRTPSHLYHARCAALVTAAGLPCVCKALGRTGTCLRTERRGKAARGGP